MASHVCHWLSSALRLTPQTSPWATGPLLCVTGHLFNGWSQGATRTTGHAGGGPPLNPSCPRQPDRARTGVVCGPGEAPRFLGPHPWRGGGRAVSSLPGTPVAHEKRSPWGLRLAGPEVRPGTPQKTHRCRMQRSLWGLGAGRAVQGAVLGVGVPLNGCSADLGPPWPHRGW